MLKYLKILKEIVAREDLTEGEIDVVVAALKSQAQIEGLIDLTQEVPTVTQALEDQVQENLMETQALEDQVQENLMETQVLEDQNLLILIASQDQEEIEEINIC